MSATNNIKCPVCGHTDMEQILVGPMLWQKDGYLGELSDGKAIDTYRCAECHYIMLFATDEPVSKRNLKYYSDKDLG